MYRVVRDGGLQSALQERRSWSAANREWLRTRMLPGAELGSCFARLCAYLASTMEPAHVLLSRCEFDLFLEILLL